MLIAFILTPLAIAYGLWSAEIYWPEGSVYGVLWLLAVLAYLYAGATVAMGALVVVIVVDILLLFRVFGDAVSSM